MSERVKELECVIADLTKQVQEARADNEKLRAALKPLVAELDDCPNDDYEHALVSFGDLRAAAAALKETGDE